MPNVVKHEKFKNDVFWVSYNNPDTGVAVDFLSIKFPESERMAVGGTLSPNKFGLGYAKEQSGNTYETFVLRSSTILPLDTFKQIAAQSLTTASGANVLPTNISAPSLVSNQYMYDMRICPNCSAPIIHPFAQATPKFCSSCGKPLSDVPKSNMKTEKIGVP